ncbi:MAG: hypothetical protein WBO24_14520 [Nitrospirales bacterium]
MWNFLFEPLKISGEKLDLNRSGRPGQIADKIHENTPKFRLKSNYGDIQMLTQFGNDLVSLSVALRLQFNQKIAHMRL